MIFCCEPFEGGPFVRSVLRQDRSDARQAEFSFRNGIFQIGISIPHSDGAPLVLVEADLASAAEILEISVELRLLLLVRRSHECVSAHVEEGSKQVRVTDSQRPLAPFDLGAPALRPPEAGTE